MRNSNAQISLQNVVHDTGEKYMYADTSGTQIHNYEKVAKTTESTVFSETPLSKLTTCALAI